MIQIAIHVGLHGIGEMLTCAKIKRKEDHNQWFEMDLSKTVFSFYINNPFSGV